MTTTPGGSALERLQEHIEAEVAAGLANLDRYRGNHLAAITPFEQEVFHIEMHDIPRLALPIGLGKLRAGSSTTSL